MRPMRSRTAVAASGSRAAIWIRCSPKNIPRKNPPTNAIATRMPSVPNRGVSSSAPDGPWSVRMPINSENSPNAVAAATTAFLSAARRSRTGLTRMMWLPSHFLDFRAAENAGRQEDQHDHQDREGGDVLVFDREIGRPERLDEPDEQAADHRAGQRADAAEHRRRERLHAGDEADVEIDHAVIEQVHDAGDGGERRPDHEGERDGAIDVDSDEGRHLEILLAGAQVGPPARR